MADPTLILDMVNGAEYQSLGLNQRYTRVGIVKDIELNNEPGHGDAEALVRIKQIPGFPAHYSPLAPGSPMILQGVRIQPLRENTPRQARVFLDYSTLPILESTYIVRDNSYAEQQMTDFIHGLNQPIEVAAQYPPRRRM